MCLLHKALFAFAFSHFYCFIGLTGCYFTTHFLLKDTNTIAICEYRELHQKLYYKKKHQHILNTLLLSMIQII